MEALEFRDVSGLLRLGCRGLRLLALGLMLGSTNLTHGCNALRVKASNLLQYTQYTHMST